MTFLKTASAAVLAVALASCGPATNSETTAPTDMAAKSAAAAPSAAFKEALAMMSVIEVAPADAASFTARCEKALALLDSMVTEVGARTGPAGRADLKDFDTLQNLGNSIGLGEASVIAEANPDEALRTSGDTCVQKSTDALSQIGLSRPVYERLSAIDPSGLSAEEAFFLDRTLKSFRRSGVDKDEATRDKIKALNKELSEISTEFSKNLREAQGSITLDNAAILKGLPQDYLDAHKPGEDGKIIITTNYPDISPIYKYSADLDLKKRLGLEVGNRAYPENEPVLRRLLDARYKLAQTLGYDSYADLIMEDKMTGSPDVVEAFLSGVEGAARNAAKIEYDRYLAKYREEDPSAKTVPSWHRSFLAENIRKTDYALDSQEVRQYFAYDDVQGGIFTLVQDLFDVEISEWSAAPVWHEDVTGYEMRRDGKVIGRFFLDMHPRDNKFKHAAAFPIRLGPTSETVPMAALMCNFPKGDHSTGLMEHGQVETFLHEFGHLIHVMFSGDPDFASLSMANAEWDFIEAPSQMLENWVWDYETLSNFAVNDKGEVLPKPLFDKMLAARDFGTGTGTLRQLIYAGVSLNYYNRPPEQVDFSKIWNEQRDRLSPFESDPRTHPYASFGHLDGYSAIYYTYQWSLAISTDMFSKFEAAGLRDPETAKAYRDKVLGQGSTKPAAALVHDFLGRDWSPEAYEQYLVNAAKSGTAE